jgi:hypothetical protein
MIERAQRGVRIAQQFADAMARSTAADERRIGRFAARFILLVRIASVEASRSSRSSITQMRGRALARIRASTSTLSWSHRRSRAPPRGGDEQRASLLAMQLFEFAEIQRTPFAEQIDHLSTDHSR